MSLAKWLPKQKENWPPVFFKYTYTLFKESLLYARKCAKKCDAIWQLFFKNECIDTAILHYIVHAFYS